MTTKTAAKPAAKSAAKIVAKKATTKRATKPAAKKATTKRAEKTVETTDARRARRLRYEAAARKFAGTIVVALSASKIDVHPLKADKSTDGLHVRVASNRHVSVVAVGEKSAALLARAEKSLAKSHELLTIDETSFRVVRAL